MYADFTAFTRDQELLASQASFDYIEGFVVLKNEDMSNGWNSVPFDGRKIDAAMIPDDGGPVMYYIELVKKFNWSDMDTLNQVWTAHSHLLKDRVALLNILSCRRWRECWLR